MIVAGVGMVYGALVNFVAQYRGKDDAVNHFYAGMAAFPAFGVYAKSSL